MHDRHPKINAALNKQMNKEFYSAYCYLACAAYFEEEELPGFANFFRIQADEELQHAMKVFEYIHQAGGMTELMDIKAPKVNFKKPLDAFHYGMKNEQELAEEINALLDLAINEKHAPTRVFMQWFVTEQVEEEALFTRCIKRVERAGNDGQGILLLDKEFAERQGGAGGKE